MCDIVLPMLRGPPHGVSAQQRERMYKQRTHVCDGYARGPTKIHARQMWWIPMSTRRNVCARGGPTWERTNPDKHSNDDGVFTRPGWDGCTTDTDLCANA